jgi:Spy/CpxP family protein refolding chaperone
MDSFKRNLIMKKILWTWIFVCGWAGVLYSQNLPPGKWWRLEPVIRELGLQNSQIEEIETLFRQNAKTMIDLKAAVEKEQVDLGALMDSDSPDKEKILAQLDRVESARARMARTMTSILVDVRRIISLEQWRKLQAIRSRREENLRLPGVVPKQRLKQKRSDRDPLEGQPPKI